MGVLFQHIVTLLFQRAAVGVNSASDGSLNESNNNPVLVMYTKKPGSSRLPKL